MFASSQTDKARAKQVSQAVEKALNDGHSISVPPAVAKVLGGTVDDKGQGNAMMKGPGGVKRAAIEAPPEEVVELMPSLAALEQRTGAGDPARQDWKSGWSRAAWSSAYGVRLFSIRPGRARSVHSAGNEKISEVIAALPNSIQLEGHTDSVPIHNTRFKSNWELSCARAIAVLETLCGTFRLPLTRFSVVGRADTFPIDSNDTPEGRARNRRVDVVIMNSLKVQPDETAAKPSPYAPHQP